MVNGRGGNGLCDYNDVLIVGYGCPMEELYLGRGIRQGDLISLYLSFFVCKGVLSSY